MSIPGNQAVWPSYCDPEYCAGSGLFMTFEPSEIGTNFASGDCSGDGIYME